MMSMGQAETKLQDTGGYGATASKCVLWLLSVVIVALIASYLTSIFTYKDSLKLQENEKRLEEIQQFQQSASALDSAFQAFNDALVDGHDVEDARRGLRTAIARHSSDANAFLGVLGPGTTKSYISGLANFRSLVDETKDPTTAMPMAQTGLDLIVNRRHLLEEVQAAVQEKSAVSWLPWR